MLVWREVPDPAPAPGEVLIDVAASGVNRAELLQAAGHVSAAARSVGDAGYGVFGVISAGRARSVRLAGRRPGVRPTGGRRLRREGRGARRAGTAVPAGST